ncbi:hypothetical protein [Duganella violaceipulchra]|uniref:Uncharacterized protein n=1 Tax=Duganella violaceipulchra TaxID=2849652 RepID=A0AA41L8T2_9BURK|nr:hypothetical protein [Duganella violaceicalia]MBV6322510.1 hypothetical protein [Duganella violaceicalia]MCP2010722.1 hypothetical protein [Duganella violaceicalia]
MERLTGIRSPVQKASDVARHSGKEFAPVFRSLERLVQAIDQQMVANHDAGGKLIAQQKTPRPVAPPVPFKPSGLAQKLGVQRDAGPAGVAASTQRPLPPGAAAIPQTGSLRDIVVRMEALKEIQSHLRQACDMAPRQGEESASLFQSLQRELKVIDEKMMANAEAGQKFIVQRK